MEALILQKLGQIIRFKIIIAFCFGCIILTMFNCGNTQIENNNSSVSNFENLLLFFRPVDWGNVDSYDLISKGKLNHIDNEELLQKFICDYSNTCIYSKSFTKNQYLGTYKLNIGGIYVLMYLREEGKDRGGYKIILKTYNSFGEKIDQLLIHNNIPEQVIRNSNIDYKGNVLKVSIETKYFATNYHCGINEEEVAENVQCFLIKKQNYTINEEGYFMKENDSEMIPQKMKKDSLNRKYLIVN